jgi:dTDP-4-dehydrorhamnose 3,5-epimerase
MQIETVDIPGVVVLTPKRFGDSRGWFCETFSARALAAAGLPAGFVQDNQSFSGPQGTLRGLHFQRPPHAQDKLVRCTRGAIRDVAVDIRRGSPTWGAWVAVELSAENGRQLLVPKGFLHGFVTLTPDAEVQYKCTDFYAPATEGAVRWDDPDLGIDWGLTGPPQLSAKDALAPAFRDLDSPFVWEAP